METTTNNNTTIKEFSSSFRWNIFGSASYESLKILHQIFLLKTMATPLYGLMGSIFSIIYLSVYVAEFGLGYSLPPFLETFIKNKKNFKNIFLKKYFLPQFILIFLGAAIATTLYSKSFMYNEHSPFMFLIPAIIVTESIRIFFRRFLHTNFISRPTVIIETIIMLIYFTFIWTAHLVFGVQMQQNLIFIPYLIDSLVGTTIFVFMIKKFYKTLPDEPQTIPPNFWKRVFKTRFYNHSIHVSKQFFTGNFLTPFFATSFGLIEAGIFNLANHIAESIKNMMKVTIFFSGAGLLAKLKTTTLKVKQNAFKLLFEKLNKVIYPLIIFLVLNYKKVFNFYGAENVPESAIALALVFLLITFMEYFFMSYEQFYIVEENSGRLFIFKLLEFSLFYTFIISKNFTTPIFTLLGIVLVRLLSFTIIATNAYALWKIRPSFKIKIKTLIIYFILSILFSFFCPFI